MFTSYKRHYFLDTPSTKGSAARQAHARTGRPDIDDTIGKKNATLSSHADSAQPRKRTLDTRPSFVRESREGLRPRLPSQAHVTKTFTRSPHMDARRSTSWNCDRHRCVRNFNGPRKRCSASYSVNNLRERSRHSIKETSLCGYAVLDNRMGSKLFFLAAVLAVGAASKFKATRPCMVTVNSLFGVASFSFLYVDNTRESLHVHFKREYGRNI